VSRTIAEYDDSRPLARKLLNARAVDMARRFVNDATSRDILRMMGKLDVVGDEANQGSGGPLSSWAASQPAIDACALSDQASTPHYREFGSTGVRWVRAPCTSRGSRSRATCQTAYLPGRIGYSN